MIPLLLAGCAPSPLAVEARIVDGGVEVAASRPIAVATLEDEGGRPLGAARLPSPAATTTVLVPTPPGARFTVHARAADGVTASTDVTAPAGCVRVELEIPAGQQRWPAGSGTWSVPVAGGSTPVGLRLTALAACAPSVVVDGAPRPVGLPTAGAREVLNVHVGSAPVDVRIGDLAFTLEPDPDAGPPPVRVVGLAFPTDARGHADPTRAPDRIELAPRWWAAGRRALGLGFRPRDDQAPWAWQAITLANDGDAPAHLVVAATITDDGAPDPAFRSRVRDRAVDTTRALVTVPAGETATAALPVFVDGDAITDARTVERRLTVTPLGSSSALHTPTAPLYVGRGNSLATAGLVAATVVSVLGWLGTVLGLRRWMQHARTSDLVTIALFGSATWVVGAAFQLVGTALGWLLGPFTPFVMGLPDQAFRACLLATLLTLLPRPGVLALTAVVGFLLRALTFGSLHPTDVLYVGSAVAFMETGAWLSGLTRGGAWRDAGRGARWIRLTTGLALPNVAATGAGLIVSATLYRLYLADWYVGGLLLFPGLLYVAIGCALAVPFAEGLREVRR